MYILNNVAKRRHELGLTQAQLAQKVGVTRRTIISLEKGRYTPSLLLALQLAEIMQADINQLFWIGGMENEKSHH